jgi:hypothetical protein
MKMKRQSQLEIFENTKNPNHKLQLLLDNDALSKSTNSGVISDLFKYANSIGSKLILESMTKIEYLRDLYNPKGELIREAIVEKFEEAVIQREVMKKIVDNSILISKILKRCNNKNSTDFVDLFLIGRVMLQHTTLGIISGNKSDFPDTIFDCVSIIRISNGINSHVFYEMNFNSDKFNEEYEALKVEQEKQKEAMEEDLAKIV